MFDIGFAEMIIVALLGLVILGPERLPVAAKNVFRWFHYLKQTANGVRDTVERELNIEQLKQDMHFEEIDKQLQSLKDQAKETGEQLKGVELDLNKNLMTDSGMDKDKNTNDHAA